MAQPMTPKEIANTANANRNQFPRDGSVMLLFDLVYWLASHIEEGKEDGREDDVSNPDGPDSAHLGNMASHLTPDALEEGKEDANHVYAVGRGPSLDNSDPGELSSRSRPNQEAPDTERIAELVERLRELVCIGPEDAQGMWVADPLHTEAADALEQIQADFEKEVYSRVEHWRSSVEGLQEQVQVWEGLANHNRDAALELEAALSEAREERDVALKSEAFNLKKLVEANQRAEKAEEQHWIEKGVSECWQKRAERAEAALQPWVDYHKSYEDKLERAEAALRESERE